MTTIRTIERKPQQASEGAPPLLLLLHGYGSNEYDLMEFAPLLDQRFYTVAARGLLNLGFGFAWYHLYGSPGNLRPDSATRSQALTTLEKFVASLPERIGTDPQRTYLLGFSQGAIMSMALLLRRPDLIAGAAILNGYLDPELLPEGFDPAVLAGKPILIEHGSEDDMIPVEGARRSRDFLATTPARVSYHEYPIGHSVHPQGLARIQEWLRERLDEKP